MSAAVTETSTGKRTGSGVSAGISDAALEARFAPVFDRIRAGALEREVTRRLPHREIGWLREAGFGRLRLPVADGGSGAGIDQLVLLLIRLGAADSNLVQALRGHVGFVESVLAGPDGAYRRFWLAEIAAGALVGNAESERTGSFAEQSTRVRKGADGRLLLNGTKYYSTGSIFADWILVSTGLEPGLADAERAATGGGTDGITGGGATVVVRADAPGVQIRDDWDGFGQRLTGSGTTVFTDVEVETRFLLPRTPAPAVQGAVYQLVHLAALAGISTAALAETTSFVRGRTRNLFNPAVPASKDPVALQVIGEAFGTVMTLEATVLAAARTVQAASTGNPADGAEAFARADAHVFGVQPTVISLTLGLLSRIFEVGGASATSSGRGLDRLWRNARTVASHNPAIYRQQLVGDYVLNGVPPGEALLRLLATPSAPGQTPGSAVPSASGSPRTAGRPAPPAPTTAPFPRR